MNKMVENVIDKALSIWYNEEGFETSYPRKLIMLMRDDDYVIDPDIEQYRKVFVELFKEVGYTFVPSVEKDVIGYRIGNCEIGVSEALPVWAAFDEYFHEVDNLDDALGWLEHFQKHSKGDNQDLVHVGDCTKFPASCLICVEENQLSTLRLVRLCFYKWFE